MYVNKVTCHFLSGNYAYISYGENPFSPEAHTGVSNADVLVEMSQKIASWSWLKGKQSRSARPSFGSSEVLFLFSL